MVHYERAFAAIRTDPRWMRKIALGALIELMVPYVGMVWVYGWELEYQRRVAWGEDRRLPKWSDVGHHMLLGLKAFVSALVYAAALLLVMYLTMGLVSIIGILLLFSGDAVSPGLGLAVVLGVWLAMLGTGVVLMLPLAGSAMLRVSLYGTIESGLQLGEIWRLMREYSGDLRKAWGYTVLNGVKLLLAQLALGLPASVLILAGVGGLWMSVSQGSAGLSVFIFGLLAMAYLGSTMFMQALGLYLRLANMHYFGSYGRVAYHLDEVRAPHAGHPASTCASSASSAGRRIGTKMECPHCRRLTSRNLARCQWCHRAITAS